MFTATQAKRVKGKCGDGVLSVIFGSVACALVFLSHPVEDCQSLACVSLNNLLLMCYHCDEAPPPRVSCMAMQRTRQRR